MSKVISIKPKPIDEYKVLSEITNLDGKRILEVGCRDGSFGNWLKENHKDIAYSGIDKNADRILEGKKKYPTLDIKCENISQYEHEPFDIVLCQNMFKSQIVIEDVKAILAFMLRLSNIAVGFTYEVEWANKKYNDKKLRLDTWTIAEYAVLFTPYVQMRTDWSDTHHSFFLYRGLDSNGKVLKLG